MAFYAPHGITPDAVRRMGLADRAILRTARDLWYQDCIDIVFAGIAKVIETIWEGRDKHGGG